MKTIITISFIGLNIIMMSLFVYSIKKPLAIQNQTKTTYNWSKLENDPHVIGTGKLHFQNRCKKCHGLTGKGTLKGPNLTDTHYQHPNTYTDIFSIIQNGTPSGNMKGWGRKLVEKDIVALTVYVKKLSSTK